jgi:hypothetical protein
MTRHRRQLLLATGAVAVSAATALAGLAAVGPLASADTAPTAQVTHAAPGSRTLGPKQLVPLLQFKGQPAQYYDCGPTSVVTSLFAVGVTPHEWDPADPARAIMRARADGGLDPAVPDITSVYHVEAAVKANGVTARISTNFDELLLHVRNGESVIMAGHTSQLPWTEGGGIAHLMTIGDYDQTADTYKILDSAAPVEQLNFAKADVLAAYFSYDANGGAGVLVNSGP